MDTRVSSTVLVGRSGELSALDIALAETSGGNPSAVLVGGEAGVGKSRLVAEFAGRARAAGVRVLLGGCLELGAESLPFVPFTSVLRGLARELGTGGVAELLPGGSSRELARLLPEFGEPAQADDTGQARARLFEHMLILLERLAEAKPVVLVIEDAHWADQSTRDLLAFLIRNQPSADGVLIVVTYRSDELHRTHPLRALLAELDRTGWVSRTELGRLSRRETGELVARLSGREPDDDALTAVYRRTEGNPLFIEALLAEHELGSELPGSLRDLLVSGLRRLPDETQDVVMVASAGGERVSHMLLAAVTGLDAVALGQTLRPAVAANVLLTDTDGFRFRHALIREAVHDELLPGERSQLHRRFAEAINGNPALVEPGRAAVEQAHHWYEAHDSAQALAGAWQAAGQAGLAVAYAEQLAMLSRVLEIWDQVPDAERRIGADHVAVLEAAVQAAALAGEQDRGIMLAQAALREVDTAVDPVRAALLLETCGRLKYQLGREGHAEDLRAAVRLVPADPPTPERARVLEALAHHTLYVHGGWGDPELRAAAEEAVVIARRTGDAATEAAALITIACAEPIGGNVARIRGWLTQARTLASQARAYQPLLGAAVTESNLLEGAGLHGQAAEVAREGLATAREYGLARTVGAVLASNLAEPLVSMGRWDEASEVIERALELMPPRTSRAYLWRLAGEIALGRGDLTAAAESVSAIRAALERARFNSQYHLGLARLNIELRLAEEELAGALDATEDALGRYDLPQSPRYAWPLMVAGARACAAAASARDPELRAKGAALADRLRAEADKLSVEEQAQRAHRLTFTAEAEQGDRAASDRAASDRAASDRAAWDRAASAWEAIGEPYPQALALLRSAEAALGDGDRDGGAARLRQAGELARRLGARPLHDDITLLARRARIALSDPGGSAAGHIEAGGYIEAGGHIEAGGPESAGLTARELEVLRLVADGQSNREIAQELFISVKTASVHVSNILRKLNAASRGEAAAIARRTRLLPP